MNILLNGFLMIYSLWLFYLAVMNLKRVKDLGKLTKPALVLGYPILIAGYLLDVICNLTVFTVLLLELPSQLTVTSRLSSHVNDDTWRGSVARWFGKHLLDQFDPSGTHLRG